MVDKFWNKIIQLPIFIPWIITLGVVILAGFLLALVFLFPAYNHQKNQLALLQTSQRHVNQQIGTYRQAKPFHVLSTQLAHLDIGQEEAFPTFILSYGTAVLNWQENDTQQKATLILDWQSFLRFWQRLTQLNRKEKPYQLHLSGQNDSILVTLTYEKK